MVFNRLIEAFTVEGTRFTEKQRYDFRVAGITLLMWGSFLYILDSTKVGKYVGMLPGLRSDGNSLDFSISGRQTMISLPAQTRNSLTDTIIKGISILLVILGISLVFVSYSRQNAGWIMPVCALFYTFAFVYLISFFRNYKVMSHKKWIYLGIAGALILSGSLIQGLVKDEVAELPEKSTTSATTKAN
jgi:hypothetical protein